MKRIIIFSLIICLNLVMTVNVYSGPFGLNMGMKSRDIGGDIKHIEGNKYQVTKVPKPHSTFDNFLLGIDPKLGLYRIIVVGKTINTSVYGSELVSQYSALEEQLNSVYGNNKKLDYLRAGSIWKERKDWMMGLLKGERVLETFWDKDEGSKMKDNITGINLQAKALDNNKGFFMLRYDFENAREANETLKAKEAGSL